MMLHVINETLRSILLSQMAEEQVGFIRGKGTREQIFKGCNIIKKPLESVNIFTFCWLCFWFSAMEENVEDFG